MNWQDERWIKVYTRDTGDWLFMSFDAQALFLMLLRKVDRCGRLALGKRGLEAIPQIVGHVQPEAVTRVTAALAALIQDGCVFVNGDSLVIPNFELAQAAQTSNNERQRRFKEKKKAGNAVTLPKTRGNEQNRTEQSRKEEKAKDGVKPEKAPASTPAPPSPFLDYLAAEFPQAKAEPENEKAWAEAFPGVDLLAQARNARRWELDNPKLIKTQKRRFLGNWFAKAQNDLRQPSRFQEQRQAESRPHPPPVESIQTPEQREAELWAAVNKKIPAA